MQETNHITIISNRKKVVLGISTILYVLMVGKNAEIHVSGGKIYTTRMNLGELEEKLGDGFIKVHRGCLVSIMAIHDITDSVNLSNGESLIYTIRRKNEMIFNEERHAVDWIFRYGNPALAKLEKLPLDQLIGSTFGSLFSNMDSKWLRNYERSALYGETLEIIDYSPEIDTYLKVICFPTFQGHCGCILFDISEIEYTKSSSDADRALMLYLRKMPEKNE